MFYIVTKHIFAYSLRFSLFRSYCCATVTRQKYMLLNKIEILIRFADSEIPESRFML